MEQKEHKEEEEKSHPHKSVSRLQYLPVSLFLMLIANILVLLSPQTPTDTPPPLPTTPLPDDYYEEAVPLDPGSTPQYFTTNINSSVHTQTQKRRFAHS